MSAHILRNHKSCTQLGRGRVTTNAYSWYSRGEREWLLRVWEREGNWKSPFPKFGNGKGIKKSIPKFREWEGNEKIHSHNSGSGREWKKTHSHNSGTGREWKKNIPKIQEREGNGKKAFLKFGYGKGMKTSIPIIQERESEAFIPRNGWVQELPLTPGWHTIVRFAYW